MGNQTPEWCIDELGELRSWLSKAKKKEKFLSEWLKNRIEKGNNKNQNTSTLNGERYQVQIQEVTMDRFQREKALSFLSEEQIKECYEVATYQKLAFKKRGGL